MTCTYCVKEHINNYFSLGVLVVGDIGGVGIAALHTAALGLIPGQCSVPQ